MAGLRLAFVTDIHHGRDLGTKLGTQALPLLDRFKTWVNDAGIDLVVELGDRINDWDNPTDYRNTQDVAAAFEGVRVPRVHILGNHDNFDLSRAESEAAFQQSFASHSRDLNGRHLVFWNADTRVLPGGFVIGEDDLRWLEADLAATELPTIVFTHVPLDSGSMVGNLYFESGPAACLGTYRNAAAARAIIEASGKVFLCVSGHTHWNMRNTIDGIHYVTIHSLTEAFTTWPHATGAWGFCSIDDSIQVEVVGRDPIRHVLPIKPPGHRWVSRSRAGAPLPPPIDGHVAERYRRALMGDAAAAAD